MHKLIVIDVSAQKPKGLGQMSFAQLPRIGEKIVVKKGAKERFYDVVMLAHDSHGAGCDIYVSLSTSSLEEFVSSLTR